MTENIKEALEYAVNTAHEKPKTILGSDGKEYYDRNKYSLVELKTKYYPKTLNLNTLDSLIDYLKSDMNNINSKRLMVIVEGPREVIVCEEDDDDLNRNVLVTVEAIISICDEWLTFINFRTWSLSNGYKESLTIDRINPKGNYTPLNCRWVSMKMQQNNKTNNRYLSYLGQEYTIAEFSEKLNVTYWTVINQLKLGWSVERIVEEARMKNDR
ncbi:TPA: hypothetical protein ACQMRA_000384 [Streptococcus pyogenes]